MSVDVQQLAINYLELDEQGQSKAHYRQSLVEPCAAVAHLVEQLHLAYNGKPAKGYAAFSPAKSPDFCDAIANWQAKNEGVRMEDSELYVMSVMVDGGRTLKRMHPAPQGRGYRVRKRSNHVTVIVDNQ